MTRNTSRRKFMATTAAVGAALGLNASVLAQDDGGDQDQQYILLGGNTAGWLGYRLPGDDGGGDDGGDVPENPTLTLQSGTTYTLLWRNVDGQPHNFAIRDSNGDNLQVLQQIEADSEQFDQLNQTEEGDAEVTIEANQTEEGGDGNESGGDGGDGGETTAEGESDLLGATETIAEEGAVQALQFTASDDMNQYICPVHPNTMVGDIELEEGDGGGGDDGTETDDGGNASDDGDDNESS